MSQFPGGGPDFNIERMADMLIEHDAKIRDMKAGVAVRRGGKSRGAYLQWLDERIKDSTHSYERNAFVWARKSFTDEFYPK
jgi:hypothetical protein